MKKFYEFVENDFAAIKSFYLKDELNSKIWTDFDIEEEIRENLLRIAQDFYSSTDLNAEIKDVILCGSLCNYNWSEKYSDFDLHIIINLKDINDDLELAEKVCDLSKKIWNNQHDITILNYEVEVAIQDKNDLTQAIKSGRMGGAYSLLKNKWVKKPIKAEFEPDEEQIRVKAEQVMYDVDKLEEEVDEDKWEPFNEKMDKVWKRIKDFRKSGLESESGEYSVGNLVFKLLRRNGYVEKVMKLKRYAYDNQYE